MDTKELLKKVKAIEIKTRGLTRQVFSGEYHSAFKGRGMAFSEVRDYTFGDDVRNLDWNVTARFNSPFIKVFEEERELNIMLLIDLSESNNFGSKERSKKELMLEIVAVLAFSAVANNDKVGAIFISDQVEKFIPPKKGKAHAMMILRHIIDYTPKHKGTNLNEGLKYFRNVIKKRSIAFVISDFIDYSSFLDGLKIANKKHDVVALRLTDPMEKTLPKIGITQVYDAESGKSKWINTYSSKTREKYSRAFDKRTELFESSLKKTGVDFASISTDSQYLESLMNLFKRRAK